MKETGIEALCFDERKDETTILEKVKTMVSAEGDTFSGENTVSRTVREEHCPLIMHNSEKMTKDLYIGTLDPENGTGACMANLLYQALEEYNSLMKIKILSLDSTPKNSGPLGGTAAILEEKIGHALQRIYCILHTIDLGHQGQGKEQGPSARS